jgi:hypothetical protein
MALRVKENGAFVAVGGAVGGWTRPKEWPGLPAVAATDQVFRGLHAVFDHEANFATIRCTGAYTVDWGDGSSPVNVASNTTAQYNYSYSASGLSSSSVSRLGYKTATVTVTPQSGQTLSVIDISQKHTQTGLVNGSSSQWLDIRLAMNNVGTVIANNSNWPARIMQRFEWVGGSSTQTSYSSFLSNSTSLKSFPLFNTAAGNNFATFLQNSGLEILEEFNISAALNLSNFLAGCSNLLAVKLYNTAACVTCPGFMSNMPKLQTVSAYNLSASQDISNILSGSTSITRILATFPANRNIGLANLSLGPAALNEIYTNLPTASGSPRTIIVTGNWGTTSHTPSIATAKGWTVTA